MLVRLLPLLSDGTNGFLLSLAISLDGYYFPKSFWEGVRESKEELAEEDRREEERKRKEGK